MNKIQFQNVGPREEITSRLNNLITKGYKDGLSIFKELIQNADDANASIVKICYDQNEEKSLFDPFMDSTHKQGQALYFYNDSEFSDSDFVNIAKLGAGTKSDSPEKIGQFGLGFTSVYNITDHPSVISRNKFMIFDPSVEILKEHIRDLSNPGLLIDFDHEEFDTFSNAFKPYEDIFGCQIKKNYHYPGTIIRLPFRKNASKISSNVYKDETDIVNLFQILFDYADRLLLFTQSVKKIEFHILRANSSDMELVYKFDVSLVRILKSHQVALSDGNKFDRKLQDLQNESSLLKAATKIIKNNKNEQKIEAATIVQSFTEINRTTIFWQRHEKQLLSSGRSIENSNNYWLIVSSFNKAYLKLDHSDKMFDTFIPCVGTALKLEKMPGEKFRILEVSPDLKSDGSIFCFLPLSIDNAFNVHINCPFALSEDRLQIIEESKDDRKNLKHEWNEYLLEPLIENFMLMIDYVEQFIKIENVSAAIHRLYPNGNTSNYFKKIEDRFYREIFSANSVRKSLPVLIDNRIAFHAYKDCVFLDFEFEDPELQKIGINFINSIFNKQNSKYIIELRSKYLEIIKGFEHDQNKFLNDLEFLRLLINSKKAEYKNLIAYFIRTKCIDINSEYAKLIKTNESILSSNQTLKVPGKLINHQSNSIFISLYDPSDDVFLNDYYFKNDSIIVFVLEKLGLITKKLPDEFIISLAESVPSYWKSNPVKAKQISENLLKYLIENNSCSTVLTKLLDIEWVQCKVKSLKWSLTWAGEQNRLFRPSELVSDNYEKYIGCIRPVFANKYCDLLGVKSLNQSTLVQDSLRQLEHLNQAIIDGHITLSIQHDNIEEVFKNIYLLLKSNQSEIIFNHLKSMNWIYCRESKHFLKNENLAFDVENTINPDLQKLPRIYQDDTASKEFLKKAGIPDYFSLESLKSKLSELKNRFGTEPLKDNSLKLCLNIVNEMIYLINENRISIDSLKKKDFYLPDEFNVLRRATYFCSELFCSEFTRINPKFELFIMKIMDNPTSKASNCEIL